MKGDRGAATEAALAIADSVGASRWRRRLFDLVQGQQVLEVGVGSGRNIPYYPEGPQFWAIDLDLDRLQKAHQENRKPGVTVHLAQMDVESLAFPTATFDCVVASLVFCQVHDPVRGLREMARVCKPGGRLLFLEHVRSNGPLGLVMDFLNPFPSRLLGEHINRRTMRNLEMAGVAVERVENIWLNVVKLIVGRA